MEPRETAAAHDPLGRRRYRWAAVGTLATIAVLAVLVWTQRVPFGAMLALAMFLPLPFAIVMFSAAGYDGGSPPRHPAAGDTDPVHQPVTQAPRPVRVVQPRPVRAHDTKKLPVTLTSVLESALRSRSSGRRR
jgi:hypothetical protein